MMKAMILSAALLVCGLAQAQAPANAPKGATGICKDGTYSMAASKSGACGGHKGVQTWYAAPAPAAAAQPTAPVTRPSAAPVSASAATPATTPAPTPGKKLSPAQAAAQKTAAPGGGPGLVWVNTASNVYHCNGDPFYGKTKAGAYMTEAQAKAKGAHGERGQTCAGK